MSVTQLIYRSRKNTLPPNGIFAIQDQARRNNAERDLTGVLLFNRDYFLQCLEGDAEQVTRTFRTISDDPRHREVALIAVGDVAERCFPDWSMGLVDSTSPDLRVALRDVLPGYEFTPEALDATTATTLMQRMRTLSYTR
ncbi:BLUF domain-containing protein [Paractinoplanes lichenicola]|uniref:BLUF domain-containing protein n=1 Tax=Paractinoplanes lichenicola TaxID=2802976 RepID=A0ABS1VXL9_9ACTN|nr:BLUF domain-containing protein [Actinoplanes lichenicola]MBL7259053.1 BLUF domain-containing protein [Actinoplanes lichenicola]